MKDVILKLIEQAPAILTACGIMVTAYFSYKSSQQSKSNSTALSTINTKVNGMTAELVEVTKAASHAEGQLQGRDEAQANNNHPQIVAVSPEPIKVKVVRPDITE